MFRALFARKPARRSAPPPPSARLKLEPLEARDTESR